MTKHGVGQVIKDPAITNPQMSTIQSICVLLGRRSAVRCGTARFRTFRSIESIRHGSASTTRPIHSRLVVVATPSPLIVGVSFATASITHEPRMGVRIGAV